MKFVKPESSIKNPHAYAARSIRVGRKYGVADAIIDFTNNFLRIYALKTKHKPLDMKQLLIYDALFCLKYGIKPCDIQIENRICQNDDVLIANPTFEDIDSIIEKIKEFDRVVREVKSGEMA